ncbi:hypothetical protein ASZ78_010741 [Callipepla squamata]|uniref:Uncharacterized protein n=1 Tax=Callipepla squamata TaxID=9009 RepID=A0A226N248_CALSU|nr:hypothetical protein ASZ78_010741 [Callipepla squamata]
MYGQDHSKNTWNVSVHVAETLTVEALADVSPASPLLSSRKSPEELDMDKVTAAMVLTSLSTSPLVRSPPIRPNESLNGSWKEGGFVPSSTSSSGYWSWNAPSDQSNPSTPSPPLSADSFKAFRTPSQPDDGIDEAETSNLLFDEPIPRKRKVSLLLNSIPTGKYSVGRQYTAFLIISELNEGDVQMPVEKLWKSTEHSCRDSEAHTDHPPWVRDRCLQKSKGFDVEGMQLALPRGNPLHPNFSYLNQLPPVATLTCVLLWATPPVNIPGSTKFTPNGSSFSISWQSPPVTFTGIPVSPTHSRPAGSGEQKQSHTVLSSPPRVAFGLRYGAASSC